MNDYIEDLLAESETVDCSRSIMNDVSIDDGSDDLEDVFGDEEEM